MLKQPQGFIVGAYPSAPSFHQREQSLEVEFWQRLAEIPGIGGIEQPCLADLHPYGDDFLFNHIPDSWQIVVTGVMETMRRRGANGGFGLASTDEAQRQACVELYRHILDKINQANDHFGCKKVLALELQSAPLAGCKDSHSAAACFQTSLHQMLEWDWPCELVVEHCDAMSGVSPRKGFLPLKDEIEVLTAVNKQHNTGISLCINWARSALEAQNITLPVEHIKQCQQAGLLSSVMFSGTTQSGPYGDWQDLHSPFSPFDGAKAGCEESLMTLDIAREIYQLAPANSLSFSGIKLLEIDPQASVEHRVAIIEDGIKALISASQ